MICTAYSDYTWEQILAQLGMTDRLLVLKKPFDNIEVSQVATALSEKWRLTNIVLRQNLELQNAVLHDRLTALPNRLLFSDRLTQAIKRSKRNSNHKLAVLFLDFDRFKIVNDSLGHDIGDLLLIEMSRRISAAIRTTDTVSIGVDNPTAARLGGDEFSILLDDLRDFADVPVVADRLIAALSAPYNISTHEIRCTVSIGISTSQGKYDTADAMLRDADTAMYRAKVTGKAHYVIFDQTMHDEVIDRLKLENDLHKAVELKQLVLYYQPIVDLESRRLFGFEALLRWRHPTLGLVPPNQFIPLAEETGLIVPVGFWVFDAACEQLAAWQKQFPDRGDLTMSINLSRRQLAAPDLVHRTREMIETHKLNAHNIKLEITESMLMTDSDNAIRTLGQLQQAGIQLHMDDFGTGFSSLSCLNRFPLDGLKIDRGFIKSATSDRKYAAVVNSIVALARNLNIDLIAEGVETLDQVAMLQAMDVRQAQGFLFAQPLTAEDATQAIMDEGSLTAAA